MRRDLLKVDPPNTAEALARAEEDDKTHGGRPVNPRSFRQVTIRAKAKAKQKAKKVETRPGRKNTHTSRVL